MFRGEVIHATKCLRTWPIWRHPVCWAGFSRPVMEIKIMLPGNYLQHNVVYSEIETFSFSFISKDCISLQAPGQKFAH
jgi:hypothetical protein